MNRTDLSIGQTVHFYTKLVSLNTLSLRMYFSKINMLHTVVRSCDTFKVGSIH